MKKKFLSTILAVAMVLSLLPAVAFAEEGDSVKTIAPAAEGYAAKILEQGYPTIQAAVDAAGDGDTIIVLNGTHQETIYIEDKELTLEGESEDGAIIQFDWDTASENETDLHRHESPCYPIIRSDRPLTLKNLTITGPSDKHHGISGVYAKDDLVMDHVTVTDIRCTADSEETGASVCGVTTYGYGVIANGEGSDVTITNCHITKFQRAGIDLFASGTILIKDNVIMGIGNQEVITQNGIIVEAGNVTIANNKISNLNSMYPGEEYESVGIWPGSVDSFEATNNTFDGVDNVIITGDMPPEVLAEAVIENNTVNNPTNSDVVVTVDGWGYTNLADAFADAGEGSVVELLKDVELTDTWTPIESFSGTFDGKGHTISGVAMNVATADYYGLFKTLNGATVENLNLDVTVTGEAAGWCGGLAGYAGNSTIRNCTVSGTIDIATTGSGQIGIAAAGVVEYVNSSVIENCTSNVAITASSGDGVAYVGGIACEVVNDSTITDCTNNGVVSGTNTLTGGWAGVGGIATYVRNGATISDCVNTAAVTGVGVNDESYAGGIVGLAYQYDGNWSLASRKDITLTGNNSSGAVTGRTIGGILGWGDVEWKMGLSDNTFTGAEKESGWYSAPAEFTLGGADAQYKYSANKNWLHVFETLTLDSSTQIDQDLDVLEGQTIILEETVDVSDRIDLAVQNGGTLIVKKDATTKDITVQTGGTLVVEAGAVTEGITVQPGGTLIAEEGATTGDVTTDGSMVTFMDGETNLGLIATAADGTVHFPATPTKTGYNFAGWFDAAVGGSKVADGATVTEDTTLYARWTAKSTGGGVSTYTVTVADAEHGAVTASRKNASKSTNVTLTVKADEGYALADLIVTDKNGNEIELTEKDGKYTFKMPGSKVTVTAAFAPVFDDVFESDYYYKEVLYAYSTGLMVGFDGSFGPNGSFDRKQLAMLLWNMEGNPVVETEITFTDVPADAWYTDAVRWAASTGAMIGYGGDLFGPDDLLTRQQLATAFYRYAEAKAETGDLSGFTDAADVDAWAADGVIWAVNHNLIQGYNNSLTPDATAIRAQVAVMLARYLKNIA